MKKFYSILLTSFFLITGCGQYSDIYYSCDGNWETKKELFGHKESEKKHEILSLTVKFIYLGNTLQTIRGFNYYNTYDFNGEYWYREEEKINDIQNSQGTKISRVIRIVHNDEKNYTGFITEHELSKKTGKVIHLKEQEFDLNRITGVIKYLSKEKDVFFISKSSEFIGQCKKIDKPI